MRNEQHTAKLGTVRVEGREPRLSETRCEDHQAGLVPCCSGLLQRGERGSLHGRRCDRRLRRLRCDVRGFDESTLGSVAWRDTCRSTRRSGLRAGMPKQAR